MSAAAPRRRQRVAMLAAIVIVAVAAVVAARALTDSSATADDADASTTAVSTATIQKGRLSSQITANGTLGYAAQTDGSPWSLVNAADGAYTALPVRGAVKRCGRVVYRVDAEPVILLCGGVPIYRRLSQGMSGGDVRELNRNLVRLGYADADDLDPESDDFTWRTAAALRDLQERLDVDETGTLDPSAVVVAPGPVRIAKVEATLGTPARRGSPVAQATSTRRDVEVDLDASQAASVRVGDRVQITLPSNTTTTGRVSDVGVVAQSAGEDSTTAKIPVHLTLSRSGDVDGLDEAPVQVEITTDRIEDAFSVPVTALVALAGGGYALETVAADGRRGHLPVKLGIFDHANGLVQVTGQGLAAGQKVVVPAA